MSPTIKNTTKMIKINFFVLLIFIPFEITLCQNINFPDANFKERLIANGIDKNFDSEISVEEALAVTYLDISGSELFPPISNISGIEEFTNLDTLICSGNEIANIDSIGLINLKYLNCSGNAFSHFNASVFPGLKVLICNPSDSLELNNPSLEQLDVQSNIFIDVSKSLVLKKLICLPSSSPSLANNKELEFIQCYAHAGQINNIDLSNNPKLKYVDIWCNLPSIDLSNNPELTYLNLRQNNILELDLSVNSKLETLNCATNQLTSLDLSNNVNLLSVNCGQNNLTNLKVNGLSKMKILACNNNQLTDINLNDNVDLEDLWIGRNLLDSLDLSKNLSLKNISCSNNNLISLDLIKNVNLIDIECEENNLTILNVYGLTKLTWINAWGNNLKNLNLSTNQALTYLGLYHNLIDSLDLSHNYHLQVASLTFMPTLKRICVSELPLTFTAHTDGSPNSYFEVCSFTSIRNRSTNRYSIYPNPANDIVIIETPGHNITEVLMYDVSGKILLKNIIVGDKLEINLSSFDDGIYILKISNSEEIITRKILKE